MKGNSMQQIHEIRDLYKTAYFLCCGATIEQTRINSKNKAVFVICGDLEKEEVLYKNNKALVNPRHFSRIINLLRDQIAERKKDANKQKSGRPAKTRR